MNIQLYSKQVLATSTSTRWSSSCTPSRCWPPVHPLDEHPAVLPAGAGHRYMHWMTSSCTPSRCWSQVHALDDIQLYSQQVLVTGTCIGWHPAVLPTSAGHRYMHWMTSSCTPNKCWSQVHALDDIQLYPQQVLVTGTCTGWHPAVLPTSAGHRYMHWMTSSCTPSRCWSQVHALDDIQLYSQQVLATGTCIGWHPAVLPASDGHRYMLWMTSSCTPSNMHWMTSNCTPSRCWSQVHALDGIQLYSQQVLVTGTCTGWHPTVPPAGAGHRYLHWMTSSCTPSRCWPQVHALDDIQLYPKQVLVTGTCTGWHPAVPPAGASHKYMHWMTSSCTPSRCWSQVHALDGILLYPQQVLATGTCTGWHPAVPPASAGYRYMHWMTSCCTPCKRWSQVHAQDDIQLYPQQVLVTGSCTGWHPAVLPASSGHRFMHWMAFCCTPGRCWLQVHALDGIQLYSQQVLATGTCIGWHPAVLPAGAGHRYMHWMTSSCTPSKCWLQVHALDGILLYSQQVLATGTCTGWHPAVFPAGACHRYMHRMASCCTPCKWWSQVHALDDIQLYSQQVLATGTCIGWHPAVLPAGASHRYMHWMASSCTPCKCWSQVHALDDIQLYSQQVLVTGTCTGWHPAVLLAGAGHRYMHWMASSCTPSRCWPQVHALDGIQLYSLQVLVTGTYIGWHPAVLPAGAGHRYMHWMASNCTPSKCWPQVHALDDIQLYSQQVMVTGTCIGWHPAVIPAGAGHRYMHWMASSCTPCKCWSQVHALDGIQLYSQQVLATGTCIGWHPAVLPAGAGHRYMHWMASNCTPSKCWPQVHALDDIQLYSQQVMVTGTCIGWHPAVLPAGAGYRYMYLMASSCTPCKCWSQVNALDGIQLYS